MLLCCLSFILDSSTKSGVSPLSTFRHTGNLLTSFPGFESLCLNPPLFGYCVEDALQSDCMAVMLGLPIALLEFSYTLWIWITCYLFSPPPVSLLSFICFHGAFASFLYNDQYVRSAADREEKIYFGSQLQISCSVGSIALDMGGTYILVGACGGANRVHHMGRCSKERVWAPSSLSRASHQ